MALPAGGPRNKGRFEARDALGMASRVAWLSRRGSHLASCWEEPIPRGQGCPAQGLQTPQGVGGVGGASLWVRPYTGMQCHLLLSFIAWIPKHIHLAKLLNVWKGE